MPEAVEKHQWTHVQYSPSTKPLHQYSYNKMSLTCSGFYSISHWDIDPTCSNMRSVNTEILNGIRVKYNDMTLMSHETTGKFWGSLNASYYSCHLQYNTIPLSILKGTVEVNLWGRIQYVWKIGLCMRKGIVYLYILMNTRISRFRYHNCKVFSLFFFSLSLFF